MSTIAENVAQARRRIAAAAESAGRDPSEVRLLGVPLGEHEGLTGALGRLGISGDLGVGRVSAVVGALNAAYADGVGHVLFQVVVVIIRFCQFFQLI